MQNNYFLRKLKPEENMISLIRRHSVVYYFLLIISAIVIVIDFFLLFWFLQYKTTGLLGFLAILIIALIVAARAVFVWYFHVSIITDLRVIDYQQKGFFSVVQKECFFDKIEEVSYNKKGVFATLFNYGNIRIKKAFDQKGLVLDKINKPDQVKELILELHQQNTKKSKQSQEPLEKKEEKTEKKTENDENKIDWGNI